MSLRICNLLTQLFSSVLNHVVRVNNSFNLLSCRHSSSIAPGDPDHGLNLKDKSISPDSMPTKELVADGHACGFSQSNSFTHSSLDSKFVSKPLLNIPSLKEGSSDQCSPSNHTIRSASDRVHTEEDIGMIPFDNLQPKGLNKLAGHHEANSARRAFEAFVGTLTRTKESISRATRLALDCAKHGIAGEVRPCELFTLISEACCFIVVYLGSILYNSTWFCYYHSTCFPSLPPNCDDINSWLLSHKQISFHLKG